MGGSANTFFRFVLGFSVFIGVSLGLTFVVSEYSIKQEQTKQTAAAVKALMGGTQPHEWWKIWK